MIRLQYLFLYTDSLQNISSQHNKPFLSLHCKNKANGIRITRILKKKTKQMITGKEIKFEEMHSCMLLHKEKMKSMKKQRGKYF